MKNNEKKANISNTIKKINVYKKIAFAMTISCTSLLTPTVLFSENLPSKNTPQTSLSLYGKAERHDNFTHYQHVNPDAPKGGTIVWSAMGTFDSLNPFVIKGTPAAGMTYLYPSLFYATLMDQSPNEPFSQYTYLAESVSVAGDKQSMTFSLRQDATFHDGSPITADDVIYSFQTLVDKGLPLFKKYYHDVKAVEKIDRFTVRFVFMDDTNKELPLLLGTFPIFSKDYHEKNGFKSTLTPPLGSGPYRIKSVDAGRSIEYERVKKWWGETLPVNKGRYNFDGIRFLYFRDPDVAFEAFKSHDFDIRVENEIKKWMTGYDEKTLKNGDMKRLEVTTVQYGLMNGLVMNLRREKFQNPKVREALIKAMDFEWLNENYFYNQYQRTTSYFWGLDLAATGPLSKAEQDILTPYKDIISPDVFAKQEYKLPATDGTGRDRRFLREAQMLLKQAGYSLQNGVLVDPKTKTPFEIEILLPQQSFVRLLNAYVKSLKRLGIQARFRIVDTAQYTARVEDFDYDMIMAPIAQSNSPGNEQREFWGSKAATANGSRNYAGIQNKAVDDIIEKIVDAQDRKDLVTHVKALDRILLWEHLVVPLWGSEKWRIAYWAKTGKDKMLIKNTGDFSKYSFDTHSWWAEKPQ